MGEALSVVTELYAAFEEGDIPGFLDLLDPQVRWHEAEGTPYDDGNPYVGPDAVVALLQRLGRDWDGFTITPARLMECADAVVATGRYTATGAATGRPLDAAFAHLWTVEGGRIASFHDYTDSLQQVVALGGGAPGPARRGAGG